MLTIALDAMGGDNAPQAEVEGAVLAARTLGVKVILVGRKEYPCLSIVWWTMRRSRSTGFLSCQRLSKIDKSFKRGLNV